MFEQNQEISHPLWRATKVIIVGPMGIEHLPIPIPSYPTLFIDGGKAHQHHFHSNMSFSIGDGDSFDGPLDRILPKSKNISDLRAGLDLLSLDIEEIYFFGFCGGRKDHEWINLGEIHQFLKRQKGPCQAYFDQDFHAIHNGTYNLSYHGLFSMLAFQNTLVTLTGEVEYPLSPPTILGPLSSLGLSNQAHGSFTLTCNLPLFLLLPGGALCPKS